MLTELGHGLDIAFAWGYFRGAKRPGEEFSCPFLDLRVLGFERVQDVFRDVWKSSLKGRDLSTADDRQKVRSRTVAKKASSP